MNILQKCSSLVAVAATMLAVNTASALQLNYDGTGIGSTIVFDGAGNFTFAPAFPTSNFTITSTIAGTGSANGLQGSIGGTFAIGAISSFGGTDSAPVTGVGSLRIVDAAAVQFNATLQWVNISTTGTGSTLNTIGAINLTNITYTGANVDLIALKGTGNAALDTLTFQFLSPQLTLAQMKSTQGAATSFSGSLAPAPAPDGGITIALLGAALTGLALMRRRLS